MVNVSTPHDSSQTCLEIIICQNQVSLLFGSGASISHSKTNICDLKGEHIVDSFSSNGDNSWFLHTLKSDNKKMFIFGTCASKDSQILCNFLESFLVLNFVNNSTSNFITFLNNTTNDSSEIFGLHNSVIFLLLIMSKDSGFNSN